jgi:Mycothiol maleylpyruvate isomerase N-terminal domain
MPPPIVVGTEPGAMTAKAPSHIDLRRAALAELRTIDFRAADRDFWSDEAAIRDRLVAATAGLDDAAWRLPGAARSDAGGPDWSLEEHVGHLVDWQEIGIAYISASLSGRPWPNDSDFAGGDFDRFNEDRRHIFSSLQPVALRRRMHETRERLLPVARQLPMSTIRTDDVWGWVYLVLHGHYLDHLTVIEPWVANLRPRQVEGEPFTDDPRPTGDGSPAGVAAFWAAHASVFAQFDEIVRNVPLDRWEELGPTPDWTLKDHVAHLARWFEEGAVVIERRRVTGTWQPALTDGLDAWNAREVAAARGMTPAEALERFDAGHGQLQAAAAEMAPDELASPEAGEWTYECLHGHVRTHLAMIGPWCARLAWPSTVAEL